MKKLSILFFALIALLQFAVAQVPQGINYQTVVRNTNGNPVTNQAVAFRISVLEDSPIGNAIYVEEHRFTTNAFGLVNFVIGSGNATLGIFENINWGSTNFFIKVETDITGGINYVETGTQQLMSVPYALYTKAASYADSVDIDAQLQNSTTLNTTILSVVASNPSITDNQTLTLSNDTLYIERGNYVVLPDIVATIIQNIDSILLQSNNLDSIIIAQTIQNIDSILSQSNSLDSIIISNTIQHIDSILSFSNTLDSIIINTVATSTYSIDTAYVQNDSLFIVNGNGNLINVGNVRGPQGLQGVQGPTGATGATGPTGATGAQGPAGPQGATGATGATGAQGSQGVAGTNGTNGADGKTILNGTSNPSTALGTIGDFYINTSSNTLFGPKTVSGWGSGTSLVGPQGPSGATGPQGATGAQGSAGPQGATGATGATGAQGPQGVAGANGLNGQNGLDGNDGLSAYQVWLSLGNTGTETDFINSLKGVKGDKGDAGLNGQDGQNGADGNDGLDGTDGNDGLSAYQAWLSLGNTGTETDFINSLKGVKGDNGDKGDAGLNGLNGQDGQNGLNGADGNDGLDGTDGNDGLSAYQVWLSLGNAGTETDFVNSLKGVKGDKGDAGLNGLNGQDGQNGQNGQNGLNGADGNDGLSAYEIWQQQGNTGTVEDFLSTSAYELWLAQGNTGTQQDFLNTLIGPAGPQGPTGVDGTGITNTQIINDSLIVTYSNSQTQNAGKVKTSYIAGNGIVISGDTISATNSNSIANAPNLTGRTNIGFASSGTWTCPAGVTQIMVQLWGGGGGGAPGQTPNGNCQAAGSLTSGGNGGKGGYNRQILTVTPGNTYTVTIGQGGNGGIPNCCCSSSKACGGSSGGDGGQTSFGSLLFAEGGKGGTAAPNFLSAGTTGSDGLVINYDTSLITAASVQVTSIRNYIPQGYISLEIFPSPKALGGQGLLGGSSCINAGKGEDGYCVISY